MLLRGLSAFPITPSDEAGRVDVPSLRKLVARLAAAKVHSVGLLGSTGTYAYLTAAERARALEAAVEEVNGQTPIVVGVGALRTDEAVRIAKHAKSAGAAAGLLAPVSYAPLNDDEVFEHFRTVAAESGLPLCIYDNPSTTHFRFSPALIGRLSREPGMIGMKGLALDKNQIAGQVSELRAAVPPAFSIGFSGDWNSAEALLAGADAWYSVLAGLFPVVSMKIVTAAEARDAETVHQINTALEPVWDLFKQFSSLRVMYAAANALDLCRCNPPRPILPIPAAAQKRVAEIISTLGLS